jgi:hypothetical protein
MSEANDHQLTTSVRTLRSAETSDATALSTAVCGPPWPLMTMMLRKPFFAKPSNTCLTNGRYAPSVIWNAPG